MSGAAPEFVQPDDPTPLEASLAFLEVTLTDLSEQVPAETEDMPAEGSVLILAALRDQRKRLAEIEAFIEAQIAQQLGKGKHATAGFQVEVKGGYKFTDWQHDTLAWQVCRDIAVDESTGEIVPEIVDIIDRVRSRLLTAARPDWRLIPLRAQGINPNDYATYQPARKTVNLTPDVGAADATS